MTGAHPLVVSQCNIFCVKVLEKLREVIRQLCQHVVVRLESPGEEICIIFELVFESWLISFKSLVKAHRVCRLSHFWDIKLKLLRKVSNPGPSNFGLIIGFHLSNFSLKSFMSIELNLKYYESNAQLFAMHLPSKMFVNFDLINSTQSKYGYTGQKNYAWKMQGHGSQ